MFGKFNFAGVEIEAKSAAFSALINLVHSDQWQELTARQEFAIRKRIIKIAERLGDGLNAEHAVYTARQWAQGEFEFRKENNDTQSYKRA